MDEVADLKSKIAQLVAVMPLMPISPTRPDSGVYHHASPTAPVVSSSGSILRLSNGSPLMVNATQQDLNNNANERPMKMMGQSPQPQMYIQQQQQQQQQSGSSQLDPNARAYTPVNINTEAV